jgi:hypothetical protein
LIIIYSLTYNKYQFDVFINRMNMVRHKALNESQNVPTWVKLAVTHKSNDARTFTKRFHYLLKKYLHTNNAEQKIFIK